MKWKNKLGHEFTIGDTVVYVHKTTPREPVKLFILGSIETYSTGLLAVLSNKGAVWVQSELTSNTGWAPCDYLFKIDSNWTDEQVTLHLKVLGVYPNDS